MDVRQVEYSSYADSSATTSTAASRASREPGPTLQHGSMVVATHIPTRSGSDGSVVLLDKYLVTNVSPRLVLGCKLYGHEMPRAKMIEDLNHISTHLDQTVRDLIGDIIFSNAFSTFGSWSLAGPHKLSVSVTWEMFMTVKRLFAGSSKGTINHPQWQGWWIGPGAPRELRLRNKVISPTVRQLEANPKYCHLEFIGCYNGGGIYARYRKIATWICGGCVPSVEACAAAGVEKEDIFIPAPTFSA